jgi:hypothetical protein
MLDGVPGVLAPSFTTEQAYALGLTKHALLALLGLRFLLGDLHAWAWRVGPADWGRD